MASSQLYETNGQIVAKIMNGFPASQIKKEFHVRKVVYCHMHRLHYENKKILNFLLDNYSIQEFADGKVDLGFLRRHFNCLQVRKTGRYTLSDLKKCYLMEELVRVGGYGVADFRALGSSVTELWPFFSTDEMLCHFTPDELFNSRVENTVIRYMEVCPNVTVSQLLEYGVSLKDVKKSNKFALSDFLQSGVKDLKRLYEAGFKASECHYQGGFSDPTAFKEAGFRAKDILECFGLHVLRGAELGHCFDLDWFLGNGIRVEDISELAVENGGFTLLDFKRANAPVRSLLRAGYATSDLRGCGYCATELKACGVRNLIATGFSVRDLRPPCFSLAELREAGIGLEDLINDVRPKASALREAGFTVLDLASYFSTTDLENGGFSRPQIEQITSGPTSPNGSGSKLITKREINAMKSDQLKKLLRDHGLAIQGNSKDLRRRAYSILGCPGAQ